MGMKVELLAQCLARNSSSVNDGYWSRWKIWLNSLELSLLISLRLSAGEVQRENCRLMRRHLARFCAAKGSPGLEALCITCEESFSHLLRKEREPLSLECLKEPQPWESSKGALVTDP